MTDDTSKSLSPSLVLATVGIDAETLVRENIHWMLGLSERLLRDRTRSEDAVQEAFVSALKGLQNFEGRSDIKTWLHRITVNASLKILRKTKQLAEQSIDELLPEFDRQDCRIEEPWIQVTSLQEIIERTDVRARVNASIDALPGQYRIVIQLRDIEGYNTSEVAELLEISNANVKVRLHRARSALKKLLEPILRGEINT